MKLTEKKLSIVIESNLDDLLTQATVIEAEVANVARKAAANGWTATQTATVQLGLLNQLKRAAQKATEGAIQSSSVIGNLERDSGGDLDKIFVWQATGSNVCPDCVVLHGTQKTMREWLAFGLPGSAPTVCGVHCVCELVEVGKALDNPIQVKRGKKGKRGGRGKIIAVYEKNKKPIIPEDLHK